MLLLPAALAAAIPLVDWCPIGWRDVQLDRYLVCAAFLTPENAHRCDGPTDCRIVAARGTPEVPAAPARVAGEAPPGAPGDRCSTAGGACTMAHGGCALAAASAPPNPTRFPGGRAYVLLDPAGASGLRSRAPQPATPSPLAVLVATLVAAAPAAPARSQGRPEPRGRPPTDAWASLPPVRAPPREG